MNVSPFAGKPADASMLVNVPRPGAERQQSTSGLLSIFTPARGSSIAAQYIEVNS